MLPFSSGGVYKYVLFQNTDPKGSCNTEAVRPLCLLIRAGQCQNISIKHHVRRLLSEAGHGLGSIEFID